MVKERITETIDSRGNKTVTHVTHEGRSGGAGKWIMLLVLIAAIVAGLYLFQQANRSEAAKDNAIAEAANDVGYAAQSAGNAVKDAADNIAE